MNAFEITEDDIILIVERNTGIEISYDMADKIMFTIDHSFVERSALEGGTFIADQTDAAFEAVWEEIETHFDIDELKEA